MTKKKLALEIIERLRTAYPDADCTLDYDHSEAWKLLVGVRLAAQCTDERVNIVVKDLYAKFPDVNALAEADPQEIEAIVRPCGLGKSKARDISACMRILRDEYHGEVPDDFDALLKLPGVGRKKCQSDHGRCIRKTGDRDRYTLYPSGQSNGTCRWDQRAEKGRDGFVEDHSSGGGQQLLPSSCISWKRNLYCKDSTIL